MVGIDSERFKMAPQVGLEPTTLRLTAGCSAIELLRSSGSDGRNYSRMPCPVNMSFDEEGPIWLDRNDPLRRLVHPS